MKFTPESFRAWERKKITLLGMSGVGKTYISGLLRRHDWFHFSGDYRIGTRYLDEPILDLIKQQAMRVPFLKELLRNDWIDVRNNIKIEDLGPVLSFVGKLGNPDFDGLSLPDFSRRQARRYLASLSASSGPTSPSRRTSILSSRSEIFTCRAMGLHAARSTKSSYGSPGRLVTQSSAASTASG